MCGVVEDDGKERDSGTICEVPDDLWEQINPIIVETDPPKATGRKRVDPRGILDGIIFRMRTGCHWNLLPRELGDASAIHRTFQGWVALGVLERIWRCWSRSARNWPVWTGNGRLRTVLWAKSVLGGCSRPQSHGSGQGGQQAERPG